MQGLGPFVRIPTRPNPEPLPSAAAEKPLPLSWRMRRRDDSVRVTVKLAEVASA